MYRVLFHSLIDYRMLYHDPSLAIRKGLYTHPYSRRQNRIYAVGKLLNK